MRFSLRWLRRPDINSQNTGHEAYQRSMGLTYASYLGQTGYNVRSSPKSQIPAGLTPGPTHKLNDPTVTGNSIQQDLRLNPLYNQSQRHL